MLILPSPPFSVAYLFRSLNSIIMNKRLQLKNLEVKSFTTVQKVRGGAFNESLEEPDMCSTDGRNWCTCGGGGIH